LKETVERRRAGVSARKRTIRLGVEKMNRRECLHLLTGLADAAWAADSSLVDNPARLFKFT
jgi:hypothetical protein